MKRNYICPTVSCIAYAPSCTLCASGDRHHSFSTGGTANPGGGR
jgi:hypothetical protein